MDRYIKIDDLMKLINDHHKNIEKDYKEGKICLSSKIAMDGTLEILKVEVLNSIDL
jgi:hypothetical protein